MLTKSEETAIAGELLFKELFNYVADPIYISDMAGNIIGVNMQACLELGYSQEELLTKHITELDAVYVDQEKMANNFKNYSAISTFTFEAAHRRKDASVFPVEINVRLIDYNGQQAVIGVARNISERKLAEETIRNAESRYKSILQTSMDGFWLLDSQGNLIEVNDAYCKMSGYSVQELTSMKIQDLEAKEDASETDSHIQKVNILGEDRFESIHRRKDGSTFQIEISVQYKPESGGYQVAFLRDITERKKIEEAFARSEMFLNTIIETEPECIKMLDEEGNLLMMNRAGLEMIQADSFEQVKGQCVCPLITDSYRADFMELMKKVFKGHSGILEFETVGLKGRHIWLETHAVPFRNELGEITAALGITRDITERKLVECERDGLTKQLLHAQKLESLGVLAGGIAHDFNNILMAIIGNADLALMRINKESPIFENLHRIEQAAAKAADLAKQMLAYSGKGKFVVESIDINNLLEDMLHMLQISISKKAVLRLNLHKNLPTVEADATQIRQIIMNLVINSSEAIGEKSGVISVTTGCINCDRSYLKDVWLDENIASGLYVYLEIIDTGCGMDKETLSKIFDPFFTTKFTGRGLGMAAVLGIVRGHKGAIKVYSELNKGTSFKIMFPASNKPPELFNGGPHLDDWKGSGTVLLIDDEETVRGIGKEMLQELGFTTITANDGREAVEIFRNNSEIAFVILDLTMPHMDGEQCFRELYQIKPDVKVIMSSGFNEQEVTQKFAGKELAGFIQKPYKLSVLRNAIIKIT